MDIKSLINPTPSSTATAVTTQTTHLPTPPLSTRKSISRKRKRHDPIPIWAIREDVILREQSPVKQSASPHPQFKQSQSQPPPQPQYPQQYQQPQPQPQTQPPPPQMNGHHEDPEEMEQSIIGEKPWDEISRIVCDFIWKTVVDHQDLRQAVAESEDTQVEIEAKWGQIKDRQTGDRLHGMHDTECVLRQQVSEHTKFESTMSIQQHEKMNKYLNNCVRESLRPGTSRRPLAYKHTRETDMFYGLPPEGFELLSPTTKMLLGNPQRHKIRTTKDQKDGRIIRKIIKHRIANMEISSPQTEWDYRISVNLEINYPGSIDELVPVTSAESLERRKDRMSYTHQDAYQIDLTQVVTSNGKNHELELELNSDMVIEQTERFKAGMNNQYFKLIESMMNNLRVLSREIS